METNLSASGVVRDQSMIIGRLKAVRWPFVGHQMVLRYEKEWNEAITPDQDGDWSYLHK